MVYTLKSVPTKQFMIRVKGDSMAPLILEGDWVLVEKRDSFESGELVVAEVDGVAVCRRLHRLLLDSIQESPLEHVREGDTLLLVANNSNYAPIAVDEEDIVGSVVYSYRCLIEDCTGPCCTPDDEVVAVPKLPPDYFHVA